MTPEFPSEPSALDDRPDAQIPAPDQVGLLTDEIWADGPTRQRQGLTWILASGLLLVLGVGGWLGYSAWQRHQVPPVIVTTVPVERQDLETRVDASGVVTLGGQQTLRAPSNVTVEAVEAKESQPVKAGQVLLILRDRSLQNDLDDARIQQRIQQLKLERQQEVVQEKQRDLNRAIDQLAESKALLAEGYISEDAYNTDRNNLETAQSDLRGAQVELETAQLEFQQTQAKITNLETQLGDTRIESPFNGVVLNINVQPGDGVEVQKDLLTIGDPNQEMIQFEMVALDAVKVRVGLPVRVFAIGPNPVKYPGRLVSIAPQAVSESDSGSDQAMVKAMARLDRPSGALIPGSTVSVEIVTNHRPDALSIPLESLQSASDGSYVWVRDDQGKAHKRSVVTGLETLEAVEIVAGLQAGDQVIVNLPPDQPLQEGQSVTTAGENETGAVSPPGPQP